jgi:hypothetical protein
MESLSKMGGYAATTVALFKLQMNIVQTAGIVGYSSRATRADGQPERRTP